MPSEILKNLSFGLKFKKKQKIENKVTDIDYKRDSKKEKEKEKRIREDSSSEEEDLKEEKDDYEIEFIAPKKKKVKLPLTPEREAEIHKEKMNHLRNIHHIHVHGSDIPDPIASFQELFTLYNLSPLLQRNMTEMQFKLPTPVQIQAITTVLNRREVMVCAPTGSGKTVAFGLPLLHLLDHHEEHGFRVLILTPTRELAMQIEGEVGRLARDTGVKVSFLREARRPQDRRKWNKSDMLITTPKKFLHCLKKYSSEINFKKIEWMVVDESDKLFEEGTLGFRDQLGKIYKTCKLQKSSGPPLKTLLFSATFAREVDLWCSEEFQGLIKIQVGAINATTENISQQLLFVGCEAGKLLAVKNILFEGFSSPALVFVQSKQRSEELVHELHNIKVSAQAIHSDKSLQQREAIVHSFSEGRVPILITTDLMCRGLDFKLVNLVINYDFPTTSVAYIHRIGRTGRAGRPGEAITFFTNDDVIYLRSIVNIMRQAGCQVPECMLKIKKPSKNIRKELASKVMERESITKDDLSDNKVVKNKMARKKMQKKIRIDKKKRGDGVGGFNKGGVVAGLRKGGDKEVKKRGSDKVINVVKDKKVKVIKMMVLNQKFKKKKVKK